MKNSWPQLLPWNKETLYSGKNCSLRLNTITYKQKMFLWNNCSTLGQSFFMSCYFTRVFVHLSVIAAVCYFSVYKLLGWDPANIYLFKVNSRNTRKRCEICPKSTINTVESYSGVFIANFEHSSHFFSVSTADSE